MKILLIEDDIRIAENLQLLLEQSSYAVEISGSVSEGTDKLMGDDYDLLICDRRLPDGDGVDVIRIIRNNHIALPILMLTAKSTKQDIIDGLNTGADDYLIKPFHKDEFLARVRSLLRRRNKIVDTPILNICGIEIDTNTHEVKKDHIQIELSPKEYAILEYLIANRGKIIERVCLLNHVWQEEVDLFSNTVDVHISYLRKKLGADFIKTIRGKGYMICQK